MRLLENADHPSVDYKDRLTNTFAFLLFPVGNNYEIKKNTKIKCC